MQTDIFPHWPMGFIYSNTPLNNWNNPIMYPITKMDVVNAFELGETVDSPVFPVEGCIGGIQ